MKKIFERHFQVHLHRNKVIETKVNLKTLKTAPIEIFATTIRFFCGCVVLSLQRSQNGFLVDGDRFASHISGNKANN